MRQPARTGNKLQLFQNPLTAKSARCYLFTQIGLFIWQILIAPS